MQRRCRPTRAGSARSDGSPERNLRRDPGDLRSDERSEGRVAGPDGIALNLGRHRDVPAVVDQKARPRLAQRCENPCSASPLKLGHQAGGVSRAVGRIRRKSPRIVSDEFARFTKLKEFVDVSSRSDRPESIR